MSACSAGSTRSRGTTRGPDPEASKLRPTRWRSPLARCRRPGTPQRPVSAKARHLRRRRPAKESPGLLLLVGDPVADLPDGGRLDAVEPVVRQRLAGIPAALAPADRDELLARGVPRLVPASHTGTSARPRAQAMTALMSATCSGFCLKPCRKGGDCRSDGASTITTVKPWSANRRRVRTRKLFSPHFIDPLGKSCRPPCPPGIRTSVALGGLAGA